MVIRTFFNSPLVRISLGLVVLTVAILLATDLLGLIPDTRKAELQSRKVITESLAVQLSIEIANQRQHGVEEILRTSVERNESILSAAVRKAGGGLLSEYGDHIKNWTLQSNDKSTLTQVYVPIFDEHGHWGNVELRFNELGETGGTFILKSSFLTFILFMALVGFVVYLLFLRRTMRELNLDAVIPERVRTALDTLAEGLLILDQDGRIIFSNLSFSRKIGYSPDQLSGKKSTELDWDIELSGTEKEVLPWLSVLDGMGMSNDTTIKLKSGPNKTYTFSVNASPVAATEGEVRGVLITFDDISEIEAKNEELRKTVAMLQSSKREVTRQNRELSILATRDPLTNTLNRRSLFQGFNTLFTEAQEDGSDLSCLMLDIDHFKSVNDQFGHAVGDEVIKFMAGILIEHSRPYDLVGRFGGEEFVVVLPNANIKIAANIAERMRVAIEDECLNRFADGLKITSSFGVSALSDSTENSNELLNEADQALYEAKEAGRNRVICWSNTLGEGSPVESTVLLMDENEPVLGASYEHSTEPEEMNSLDVIDESLAPGDGDVMLDMEEIAMVLGVDPNEQEQVGETNTDSAEVIALHPEKMLLIDRIEQAIKRSQRNSTQFAVLVIDADAIQRVNDTLGHIVGEKFCRAIMRRIKQYLRNTDLVSHAEQDELLFSVSRFTGNEIVVLLTDLKEVEILTTILQRIFSLDEEPIEVEGAEFYTTMNIGISLYPQDGENTDTLIKNAGIALRETKNTVGENNFHFFSDDINKRSKKHIRLDAELHQALERNEFVVYYQPKVDLKSGTIQGMEALLRWDHPQLGILAPNDFIPQSEQTGFIEKISQWVIRDVCRQISLWQRTGFGFIQVAINLSPVEFRNEDLAEKIIELVNESGIPTSAIEIEITETVVMHSMDTAVGILNRLSDAGIQISLDDFGTGYSSLSYLKLFPLSGVKIDRSFIADVIDSPNDATIVNTIIAMGHSMGIQVIAEGVETEEQLHFLRDLQCDVIQGYLISRPVPGDEATDLLANSSGVHHIVMDNKMNAEDRQSSSSGFGVIGILNNYPVKNSEENQEDPLAIEK